MDALFVAMLLMAGFVLGGLLGYRLGIIDGYDRAEELFEQIIQEQNAKIVGRDPERKREKL